MTAATGRGARGWACFLTAVVGAAAVAAPARADDHADARAHYDKGTAAYALGHYADAAVEFEQAFTLKPDPAILYNAAQAYRLGGRRDRALELYRSFLRVYGRRAEHAPDVEWHISELEKLPPETAPVERRNLSAHEPLPAGTAAAPSLVAPPALAAERPLYRRWWFWASAGALVVAAAVVGVALAARRSPDCGPGVDYCANTGL